MKEKITSFDLEAAFKALDEIDYPKQPGKVKANRMDLSETFSKKLRTDILVEDYYSVSNQEDLTAAQEEREGEVAKAKLARIEKIVDLDAESEEDLLGSYVGKSIIQCPQCMTLFYKSPEDIEISEEDPNTVNIGEKCQHCGNIDGYTIVGKVAEVSEDERANFEATEEPAAEEGGEEAVEATTEDEAAVDMPIEDELPVEDADLNLEPLPEENVEDEKEEKKEESLETAAGEVLVEEIDKELNKKLEEHDEYIKYLQEQILAEEKALTDAKNDFVKAAIERRLEALNADLEAAIPEELKAAIAEKEAPVEEPGAPEEEISEVEETEAEEPAEELAMESLNELFNVTPNIPINLNVDAKDNNVSVLSGGGVSTGGAAGTPGMGAVNALGSVLSTLECKEAEAGTEQLNEEELPAEISEADAEKLLDSPEFQKPISSEEVEGYLDDAAAKEAAEDFENAEEIDEATINQHISDYLTEVYKNVRQFEMNDCLLENNKLIIEGNITFNSGKTKATSFELNRVENTPIFEGYNKTFTDRADAFKLEAKVANKTIYTENFQYKYEINTKLVEGYTKH